MIGESCLSCLFYVHIVGYLTMVSYFILCARYGTIYSEIVDNLAYNVDNFNSEGYILLEAHTIN